jgi:hypothetical protein
MIRADVQMSYFRKFLWIALACVGGIAWCAYDVWITYPRKLEIASAYESIHASDTEESGEEWEHMAEKNGWPLAPPGKSSQEIQGMITNQYLMIVACVLVGGSMLLRWFLARGSWIEGDETQFRNSRGKTVSLDALVSIDVSRWEEKGIAVLRFGSGWKSRKFVLDDFKYDQEATGKLLEIAKARLADGPTQDREAS